MSERVITVLLASVCVVVAAWHLAPRVRPAYTQLSIERGEGLTVSVTGAVRMPGAYTLPWGARVGDLLTAAGGATADAEASLVNSARPLTADEAVHVPLRLAGDGTDRVSINSADEWALQRLPGVGPSLARRIILGRPYLNVDELVRVSGIGEATLARLRPLIRP